LSYFLLFLKKIEVSNSFEYVNEYININAKDFSDLTNALEKFSSDSGFYPISSKWSGFYSFDTLGSKVWIPGLVPVYLTKLPREPRKRANSSQYLYKSDGKNFKLINHDPPVLHGLDLPFPLLEDPLRKGFSVGCWSKGAENW
jgi:hypothetical protein